MLAQAEVASRRAMWTILVSGGLVVFISMGMRHSFGFFLDPVTNSVEGITRETFGFAIALQNLVWGIGQPFAGAIADRVGSARVIFAGGLVYGLGLAMAAALPGAIGLYVGLGFLVGLGLSCTTFAVVLGAVGRRFAPERRSGALGIASVGGSLGMFCSVPATVILIAQFGWAGALLGLSAIAALMCLAAPRLAGRSDNAAAPQSFGEALSEALHHRGFLLLIIGFFVCGFQLAFIATHLPAFLLDRQLGIETGGIALATIGAANVVGTFACGAMGDRMSKKNLLVVLYLVRSATLTWYILTPVSLVSTVLFGLFFGLTWLGTVPLTSGIVAQVFGPRYISTLIGIVFLMHQTGSFLGAWMGGYAYDKLGSYNVVFWVSVLLGCLAAILHWPIDERPLAKVSAGELAPGRS